MAQYDRAESAAPAEPACCHHVHDRCGTETKPAPTPCDCKPECKSLCIYLPPEKCIVDAGDLSLSIDVAIVQHDSWKNAVIEAAAASSYWEHTRAFNDTKPPVRLHLLHQIILI